MDDAEEHAQYVTASEIVDDIVAPCRVLNIANNRVVRGYDNLSNGKYCEGKMLLQSLFS